MKLSFSTKPGCRERQLQRRVTGVLFSEKAGFISQGAIDSAQKQDAAEKNQYATDIHGVLLEVVELKPNVPSEAVLALKEKLEKLEIRLASLAGDTKKDKASLEKLHEVIVGSIRQSAGNDPLALEEMQQEETAYKMHHALLAYPVVAALLRLDSPIAENELMASIFEEELAAFIAVLRIFDLSQTTILLKESSVAIAAVIEEGGEVSADINEKQSILERYVASGADPMDLPT